MREITKSDICGARITAVHATWKDLGECMCTNVYFTVDRGFTFSLPFPGYAWSSKELPPDAHEYREALGSAFARWLIALRRKLGLDAPVPSSADPLRRIKEHPIQGMYCRTLEDAEDSYMPDDSVLVLDDGSQVSVTTVAPHGISTGFFLETPGKAGDPTRHLVDFFNVPLQAA